MKLVAKKRFNHFLWLINRALLGAIDAGRAEQRIQDALDQVAPGRELSPSRADTYTPGQRVSIESEIAETLRIQEALDLHVNLENQGVTITRDGRPPCLRAKEQG